MKNKKINHETHGTREMDKDQILGPFGIAKTYKIYSLNFRVVRVFRG